LARGLPAERKDRRWLETTVRVLNQNRQDGDKLYSLLEQGQGAPSREGHAASALEADTVEGDIEAGSGCGDEERTAFIDDDL
jgi:hypothetical protein